VRALLFSLALAMTAHADPSSGALSPSGAKHPGSIFNDDKVHGRTFTQKAADVPQSIAWVEVDGTWRAVVRIVVTGVADRLEITQYAADGTRLKATYQAPSR